MAKSIFGIPTPFIAIIFAFLLMNAALEKPVAEGKICSKRSKTWTGPCIITGHCSNQCKHREDARSGSCHFDFPGFACFCYFNC
ncbi:hypothetical protein vseg_006853 [Gypsophila vaccaria]